MLNDPSTHKAISTVAYSSSGATAAGGFLSANEIAIGVGILCALCTAIVNWYYRAKQNKRDAEKHELDIKVANAKLEQISSRD